MSTNSIDVSLTEPLPVDPKLKLLEGDGAPAAELGINYQLYRDNTNDVIYEKTGTWKIQFRGTGQTLLKGDGPPDVGLGEDGEYYLDELTNDLYLKSFGTWGII